MEAVFLFCADAGAGPDGRLNIHGVFSELYAPGFPARQDRIVLAGIVEWQPDVRGRVPFRMNLTDPEGKSVFTIDGHTDVDLPPGSQATAKTQFVLPLEDVVFPEPGRYRMHIELAGESMTGPSMHLLRSPGKS